MYKNKELYSHDFCMPFDYGSFRSASVTFSIGIFEWIPTKNGKGVKKSAVKFRVKGYTNAPKKIFDAAIKYCEKMDNGFIPPTKSVMIK